MLWSFNMLHWSCCADLWLHNTERAYTYTIWESFTCCLILAVDFKPIKEAGCLVFPCCIAAISTAFDLKNASPLVLSLHWWWLTLQHTLQKSPLTHPRGREREKEERDVFFYVPLTHNTCSCVLIYLLCLHKYLYSSAFPLVSCRVEMQLVFLHC